MKTVIKKLKLKSYLIYILLVSSVYRLNAFQINDTIYITYSDNMVVSEKIDTSGDYHIKVNIALTSVGDDRITTYEFKVHNINKDFKWLKFKEAGDTIPQKGINPKLIKNLKELSQFSACNLLYMLADTKNVFLLKVIDNRFIRYRLTYLSTKRGWLIDKSGYN